MISITNRTMLMISMFTVITYNSPRGQLDLAVRSACYTPLSGAAGPALLLRQQPMGTELSLYPIWFIMFLIDRLKQPVTYIRGWCLWTLVLGRPNAAPTLCLSSPMAQPILPVRLAQALVALANHEVMNSLGWTTPYHLVDRDGPTPICFGLKG